MPDWKKEIRALLDKLELEPARESEITEELAQHLADRYEELVAQGSTEEQAYSAVVSELRDGKLTSGLRSAVPRTRPAIIPGQDDRGSVLLGVWRDLHYGARGLRLNPGFAVIAILSLALGIGANTAIFQLLDAVRIRTLPVKDPQQLAEVVVAYKPHGVRTGDFTSSNPQLTNALWEQIRAQQQAFSGIAAWSSQRVNTSPGGEAHYVRLLWASGSFFDVLGIRPAIGRLFSPADDQRGCGSPGAVISYSYWQREFGGRNSVLGERVTLERHSFEIIGVAPASFFGIEVGKNFEVALPLCAEPIVDGVEPRLTDLKDWWLGAIGRLKPGWSLVRASAQLAAISPGSFEATLPSSYDPVDREDYLNFKLGASSVAAGVSSLRREYETPLWLLLAIAGLVLLIACANLANLMLARASARQREMAVRLALGASPIRLLRQLLAESLLLAIIGATCGVVLARFLSSSLVSFLSTQHNQWFLELGPDWRALCFTAALAMLTCVLFGLAPALQSARVAPSEAMKASGRSLTAGSERFGLRRTLVVSQVALSLVLLVGALLFVRTLRNLSTLDAGFQQDGVLIADIDLSPVNTPPANRTAFKQELLSRIRAIPGVNSAAQSKVAPVSGNGWNENISIPGSEIQRRVADFNQVSPGYFKTLGTPLLAGRDFNEQDTLSAPPVAIVSETFVRKFLNGANPIGKTFDKVEGGGKPNSIYQIVGLVKDMKYQDLREDFQPIVFLPSAQDPQPDLDSLIIIRSDEPAMQVVSAVKRVVQETDPALALNFSIFKKLIGEGLLRERLMATLSGFFGFVAALLAVIGLYGVISYMVVRRRNEIGVRMALGANRKNILLMVMREATALLGVGLVIGGVLALLAASAARALLFGLRPSDPVTLIVAVLAMAMIAAVASFVPAQRAAQLDPMVALREE